MVVVRLNGFSCSGCVVDDVSAIQLVEAYWRHGVYIILYSRQVHEVNSFMRGVIVLPYFVKYPL